MPKKKPTQASTPAKPLVGSPSEYIHKVETVCVRYQNGKPVQIVHPTHLTCLQLIEPKPPSPNGRPRVENTVRYLLNRVVFDHLFIPRDTPPQPLSRYGLATLALKWRDTERDKILQLSVPEGASKQDKKQWEADKKKRLEQLAVSRNSIDTFLKRFSPKPGEPISIEALHQMFPLLGYN